MSSYCNSNARNCTKKCCSVSGTCPTTTSNCYYYYNGTIGTVNSTTTSSL